MHIAFLFTHGFAARMVLRTGVARQLIARGVRVSVLSPNADETYFRQECEAENIFLQAIPENIGRIAHWFRMNRPYFLDDVMNNPALKASHARRFERRLITGLALAGVNRTFARWSSFRRLSRSFEWWVNYSKAVEQSLQSVQPDLLVIPNPFGTIETLYLLHSRRLQIPTICQMLSWDNITSKGTPATMPDYFISWGPIMTEEMVTLYRFPRSQIYECGVPHFDVYSRTADLAHCDIILRELNLPVEQPYLFYGMVTEIHCPKEIEILSWLAQQINNNAFVKPCSLIIRPHPQTISGVYAHDAEGLGRLKALVSSRVALDMPPVLSEQLAWDLPKSDMHRLANLLAGSAMCLNSSSTLCLDACMLNRPVIDIGFDGCEELEYERSARRVLDYTHMAKLLALGGIRVARSFAELKDYINTYLANPNLEREKRLLAAMQECGPCDGRATERVANTLFDLVYRETGEGHIRHRYAV